jgi:hypothetical protein
MPDIWSDVVPGWISAIGTAGAAGAAAWGLWQAEATAKRARADADAARQRAVDAEEAGRLLQEREAERAQASRVNVWESWVRWDTVDELEPLPATADSINGSFRIVNPAEYGADRRGEVPAATLHNASDQPIRDVVFYWMNPNGSAQLDSRPLGAAVVEPHQTVRKQRPRHLLDGLRSVPVELQFTDAAGRSWRMDRAGRLEKLGAAPAPS